MVDGGNLLILGIPGTDLFFPPLLWGTEPLAAKDIVVGTTWAGGEEKFMVE